MRVHVCSYTHAYVCLRVYLYVQVRKCACILRACTWVYARVRAFACTCARVCVHLRVCVDARVVDLHACVGTWTHVCMRFSADAQQCPILDDWAKIKKQLITAKLIKMQSNFLLCIIYTPKPFFWYLNLLDTFYGISIISICQYMRNIGTLTLYN